MAGYGAGRVVVMGDFNLWDNYDIANANYQLFAENVFAWLMQPGEIEAIYMPLIFR